MAIEEGASFAKESVVANECRATVPPVDTTQSIDTIKKEMTYRPLDVDSIHHWVSTGAGVVVVLGSGVLFATQCGTKPIENLFSREPESAAMQTTLIVTTTVGTILWAFIGSLLNRRFK